MMFTKLIRLFFIFDNSRPNVGFVEQCVTATLIMAVGFRINLYITSGYAPKRPLGWKKGKSIFSWEGSGTLTTKLS